MSFGTLLGFLGGLILFAGSVFLNLGDASGTLFLSVSSFIMVFGGTLANAYICYQAEYVNRSLFEIVRIFSPAKVSKNVIVQEINKSLEWADIAFKKGPTGLEDHLKNEEPDDHLLGFGVDLVLREYDPNDIRQLMTNTIESEFHRTNVEVDVLENMASNAPAFGMIGTLVGLIIMLSNMENPEELGTAMGLALLTTLYGVLFTRLIFQPASKKVLQRAGIQRFRNMIMMEIFILISEKRPAGFVRDRIRSFLRPSMLIQIDNPRVRKEEPPAPVEEA